MSKVEVVEMRAYEMHGMVIIRHDDSSWYTFCRPWWDLSSWLWWWLMPGEKGQVVLTHSSGKKVRMPAVRLSKSHLRLG